MTDTGSTTSSGRAYVSNSYSDTVSVIDTTTNAVIATIGFDDAPRRPTASADNAGTVDLAHGLVNPTVAPDGQHVYVAKSVGGGIAVIDVETNVGHEGRRCRRSEAVRVGVHARRHAPGRDAARGDGRRPRCRHRDRLRHRRGGGPRASWVRSPSGSHSHPTARHAYVVNLHSKSLSVFDVDARVIVATIALPGELPFNLLGLSGR